MIEEIYNIGLEKFEGDHEKAAEFTKGFMKEASKADAVAKTFGGMMSEGVARGIGSGLSGLGVGLGIAGLSAAMLGARHMNLRSKYEAALKQVISQNATLRNADHAKLLSYAETVFRFAPNVACDPNLLGNVLSSAIHGDSMDLTTVRTLADLESRHQDTSKNGLFSPKAFV